MLRTLGGWCLVAACGPATDATGVGDPLTSPAPIAANVLLVLLDDVGVEYLGGYTPGPGAAVTPVIDGLADAGIRFDRAWAHPLCSPTRAAILTGQPSHVTGVGWALGAQGSTELPEPVLTLPELLSPGIATAAIGKWHLSGDRAPGNLVDDPLEQGFDHFVGSVSNVASHYAWTRIADGVPAAWTTYTTTTSVDDALAFIDQRADSWFVYLSLHAAHAPYEAPPTDLVHTSGGSGIADHHVQMIEAVDTEIGRLLDSLDPAVRAATTVIVFGDNGTPEAVLPSGVASVQSKGNLTEGGIRVPLVITGPQVARGGVSTAVVQDTDLFPTIAEIFGVPPPPDLDGVSLLPLFTDPEAAVRQIATSDKFLPGANTYDRAAHDGRYKLLQSTTLGEALFDLTLGEDVDLLAQPLSVEVDQRYQDLRAAWDFELTELPEVLSANVGQ